MTSWPDRENALRLSEGLPPTPANLSRVADACGLEAARWAFSQWDLRSRASAKFPLSHRLFFVKEALEQSTHHSVARYHASLFPPGVRVFDLTAGIGGDALALAERGPVTAFELDPDRFACLQRNASALARDIECRLTDTLAWLSAEEAAPEGQPEHIDDATTPKGPVEQDPLAPKGRPEHIDDATTPKSPVEQDPLAPKGRPEHSRGCNPRTEPPPPAAPNGASRPSPESPIGVQGEYLFADPARRVEGRRTLKLEEFAPNPLVLADHAGRQKLLVMKLSPLLNDRELEQLGSCVRFVSFGGECREALVLAGTEAPSGWGAVLIDPDETVHSLPRTSHPAVATDEPLTFLHEADPAAIRAGALSTLCDEFGCQPLADSNGYLTSNEPIASPWLTNYRILDTGSPDPKRLRRVLDELGAGPLILKQRHAGLDLEKLRKQLSRSQGRELILAFYRKGKSIRAVILEPA